MKVGGLTETVDVLGESPLVDVTSSATDNKPVAGHPVQLPDPLRQRRDRAAQLRCPASTTSRPTAATPIVRQRAPDRRRRHPRPLRRHGLDLLQLQHRRGGAGGRRRRARRVRSVLGRRDQHRHQVGRQPLLGPVRRHLHERRPGRQQHQPTRSRSRTHAQRPRQDDAAARHHHPALGPIIKDKLFFFASAQRYHLEQDPSGPRHAA